MRARVISAVVLVAIAAAVSVGWQALGTESVGWQALGTRSSTEGSMQLGVHGLQEPLKFNALAARSDAVVIGTVLRETVTSFEDNPAIGPEGRKQPGYVGSTYKRYNVTVHRVLSGQAEAKVTVASMHELVLDDETKAVIEGGDGPTLSPGSKYVLFVSKGDLLWAGHYLVLGPQGQGSINANNVQFGDGRTVTVAELVDQLRKPLSDEERYVPKGR